MDKLSNERLMLISKSHPVNYLETESMLMAHELLELREQVRIYTVRMEEINGFAKKYQGETAEATDYAWSIVEEDSRPLHLSKMIKA